MHTNKTNKSQPKSHKNRPNSEKTSSSLDKAKTEKESEEKSKIYNIIQGIAKNLNMTNKVKVFKILNLNLKSDLTEFLSEGISSNKSLKSVIINNCVLSNETYAILLKGILTHELIEFLDLSNNNLNDNCGNMIGRIISRQNQRRDQVVWMYGLRNEVPSYNDYMKGLISINLSNNQLSDISAGDISNSLSYDSYIRSINLNGNEISIEGVKKFIKVLRKNLSILNIDLRNNPGYCDDSLHKRLILKLSKNLKILHQQYMNEIYSKQEYEYLKKFVNYEFFNIDIPQHIVEIYNSRIEETKEIFYDCASNSNSIIKKKNSASSLEERRKLSKEKKKTGETQNKKKNFRNKEILSSMEDEEDIYNVNSDNLLDDEDRYRLKKNVNHSDSEAFPNTYSHAHTILAKSLNTLKEQNRKLFMENLQIRKQMLAMRAQHLLNQTNVNRERASVTSIQNVDDINPITQNLSLTALNNVNVSSNPKLAPMTGEDGSYDIYYNRVENLFSELTRLMDSMENNFRRNES